MKLDPREARLARDAIGLARVYRQAFQVRRRGDLGVREMESLLVIAIRGSATATEVSYELGRDLPSISRSLRRLRNLGLVSPVRAKGRAEPHVLTEAGYQNVKRFLRQG